MTSPSARNPIGRYKASRPPNKSEEAAMNPHPKASNTVHFLQVCLNPGMHGRVDPLFADTLRQPRALERIPNRGAGPGQPQLCSSLLQLFSQLAQSVDTLYVQPGGCLGVKKDHPDRGAGFGDQGTYSAAQHLDVGEKELRV